MGEINKLQTCCVGYHSDKSCAGCHFALAVEHERESIYAAEACDEPYDHFKQRSHLQLGEICGREVEQQCDHPACYCCHQYYQQSVGYTLQTRPEIQLCKVDAARYQREARYHEQHGADVARLVNAGNVENHFKKLEKQQICTAGGGNSRRHVCKQRDVALQQLFSDVHSHACAEECKDHFNRPAAQQECKSAAGKTRCQTQIPCLVIGRYLGNFVKYPMKLQYRVFCDPFRKAVRKIFKLVELVGVYACGAEGYLIGVCIAVFYAGAFDGQQTNIRIAHNAQRTGYLVHRSTYSPCSRSHRKHHHSHTLDQRGFFLQSGVHRRLVVFFSHDLVPVDGHMLFPEFAHCVLSPIITLPYCLRFCGSIIRTIIQLSVR